MISIIVPVYNVVSYIDECLASISTQTYTDFEVLLINDGSSDGSALKCSEWETRDPRFKLLSQKNQGVSIARNLGLDNASGEYVCFIDSDDVVHKDFLKNLLSHSEGCDLTICDYTRNGNLGTGDIVITKKTSEIIKEIVFERIKHPNIVCFLYKRRIIEENSLRFTPGCIKNEDYEFYMRYIIACNKNVAMLSYVGYYYRPNPSSAMYSPITIHSLTSIEASRRVNIALYEAGFIHDNKIVFSNGVLTYAYSIARWRNKKLYNYLHNHYDVKAAMKKMLSFPRFSKKLVAITYLIFGREMFYYFIGLRKYSNL